MSNRRFTFDLNTSSNFEETSEGQDYASEEESDHTNFEEEQSQENARNARSFILDLNEPPPILDLNEPPPDEGSENVHVPRRRIKILKNETRHAIYFAMLKKSVNGKIKWGTTKAVAEEFSVSMRTVQRIWKRAKNTSLNGVVDVSHRKSKNCGRKRVQIDLEQLWNVPLSRCTTLQSTAYSIKVPKTTLYRRMKDGDLRRHSNCVKPFLTDTNMKARVEFCLSMLDKNSLPYNPRFVNMENIVHIDENWFYMTKKSERYYLLADEEEPLRTCKSKNFVLKVMFLAAIARPRFDTHGNVIFSGKIGIFPFVTKEPAKRSSVNRAAGTLETKVMTSVGRDIIRSFLIEKVLPQIRAKWPEGNGGTIYIQQDNARTHVVPNDVEFCQAASQDGFDIRLMCQPANSPDLNILDLGFFNAIQSLRNKEAPKTIDELIGVVERSFEAFSPKLSNRIFCSLQQCMVEILKVRGSFKYNIPHIKKNILERQGQLPRQMQCDANLVEDAVT